MRADQRLELGDQLPVTPELEICIDPRLGRLQAQLLEPADRLRGERLVLEPGERAAAPQAERRAQRLRGRARIAVLE